MLFYDKDGTQISQKVWEKNMSKKNYRNVKQTVIKDGKFISTVFLGYDIAYQSHSIPPGIFETMVFPKKGDWMEIEMVRYATLDEAKKGHQNIVEKYKQLALEVEG